MTPNPLRRQDLVALALLVIVIAVAAFLRFDGLGKPSYWLDEILGEQLTTKAAAEPLWRWVTGLEREHGPLYYATQLASRVAGNDEAAGRLPAALFGLATIPLIAFAVRLTGLRSAWGGAAAAIVLASSPLHVYYSREARPYGLLILLTAALLIALLAWSEARSRERSQGAVAALLVATLLALLYTSAVAAPVVASAFVVVALAALMRSGESRKRPLWIAAIACGATTALFPLLYRGVSSRATGLTFPEINGQFLQSIATTFTVSVSGINDKPRVTAILLLLAIAGVATIAKGNRKAAVIVTGMALLPVVIAVAGLKFFGHWSAMRYLSPAVVGFVTLIGAGVAGMCDAVTIPLRRRTTARGVVSAALTVIIALALARETWPAARREPFEKLDWRAIAAALERHVRSGDVIIAAEGWSDVSLRYYLRHLPPGVRVAGLTSSRVAEAVTRTAPASWLVTAGFSGETEVRDWMCGYPLLMSARLEDFRLHYAPSATHFIQQRGLPADVRALAASLGTGSMRVHGAEADILFGAGFGRAEPDGRRWAMAKECIVIVPRQSARDRVIRISAFPVANRALPPQNMHVLLNGTVIGAQEMPVEWYEYRFSAPASLWREGLNSLSLQFTRTTAPADLDPKSGDRRTLAASIDYVAVDEAGAPVAGAREVRPTVRMADDALAASRTSLRTGRTRFAPERLNRSESEALLGRLGFDPTTAWPRIARGELSVEMAADVVAFDSRCEDDRTFLKRAFATLVQRAPNDIEDRDLMARLRVHEPRTRIVRRILWADDFAKRLLRPSF